MYLHCTTSNLYNLAAIKIVHGSSYDNEYKFINCICTTKLTVLF